MAKLNMELDKQELEKLKVIRAKYGIKQLTEIVRLLISKEADAIALAQAPAGQSAQVAQPV